MENSLHQLYLEVQHQEDQEKKENQLYKEKPWTKNLLT